MVETKMSSKDDTNGLLTHSERYKNLLLQVIITNSASHRHSQLFCVCCDVIPSAKYVESLEGFLWNFMKMMWSWKWGTIDYILGEIWLKIWIWKTGTFLSDTR